MTYMMPLSAADLGIGERYHTFTHGPGIQGKGKDIGCLLHEGDSSWRRLKAVGADTKKLSNWIIYGKPFYAMAAGTVVGAWRNAPENTPGNYHPDIKKFAGGGNHLWILQDDGVHALYAHAATGSIPSELCPHEASLFTSPATGAGKSPDVDPQVSVTNGARVEAGQFLGRVGNSGASKGGPHLHVHMEKGGSPVAMKFGKAITTPYVADATKLSGPWKPVAGATLPLGEILFWPPRPVGNYTFNGTPRNELESLVAHLADSGMMPDTISCTDNGKIYSSTWVPGKGSWLWFYGATADAEKMHKKYLADGFKRTSSYTCGTSSVAVWRR